MRDAFWYSIDDYNAFGSMFISINEGKDMSEKNYSVSTGGQYKTEEEAVKAAKKFAVQYRQPYKVFKAFTQTVDKSVEAVEMEKVEA